MTTRTEPRPHHRLAALTPPTREGLRLLAAAGHLGARIGNTTTRGMGTGATVAAGTVRALVARDYAYRDPAGHSAGRRAYITDTGRAVLDTAEVAR